ncbi:UNVERIFIED_CONTAM: hypothetical protein Sradi_0894200 [Sesamum radiatum]|uniref:Uncharacterized protein n=1 Tax=Sesamum radiatum TaxID=300843 RepID=A0AAW2V1W3_SESRA
MRYIDKRGYLPIVLESGRSPDKLKGSQMRQPGLTLNRDSLAIPDSPSKPSCKDISSTPNRASWKGWEGAYPCLKKTRGTFISVQDILQIVRRFYGSLTKINESSAKRRWDTGGVDFATLTPSRAPSPSPLLSSPQKASAQRRKRYGDKGSPRIVHDKGSPRIVPRISNDTN